MASGTKEALPNGGANTIFIIVFIIKCHCFLCESNIRSSWLPFPGRSLQTPIVEPGCETKEADVLLLTQSRSNTTQNLLHGKNSSDQNITGWKCSVVLHPIILKSKEMMCETMTCCKAEVKVFLHSLSLISPKWGLLKYHMHHGGGCVRVGTAGIPLVYIRSVLSTQLCWEPKTALKNKAY